MNEILKFNIQDFRFEAIYSEIKSLLGRESISLLILKGPHLAHSIYEKPSERIYGDLDLLVKPESFKKAAKILRANNFTLIEESDEKLATNAQTNHWMFRSRFGQLIELHRGFVGLRRHQCDLGSWFTRAETFNFGNTPALGLATEDLLCHLCLHIGKSFFYLIEEKHIRDLDRVIRKRGIQWDIFFKRCRETHSKAIAYYCLQSTQARYDTPIPTEVFDILRPSRMRRFWLEKHLDINVFPIYRFHALCYMHARRRLTLPLLDGIWNWGALLARALAVKGMDVVLRFPVFKKWWKKRHVL
ncbi:MAG: nucleotidyltransferase family protein [Candidatus Aminicenantes bacterium]|nr:nucleotidyltransferase family protein [Candidatus Aminicenantes bacterium]